MRVEAGLAALEEAEHERNALRSALAQCEADLRGVRAELDMVNLAHTRAHGRNGPPPARPRRGGDAGWPRSRRSTTRC